MNPIDFSGRGPKGYRRSDERIREEICERLTEDALVDASEMEIEVVSGEVTLRGTVPDRYSKRRAEALIDDVRGVIDVHNELRIPLPPSEPKTAPPAINEATVLGPRDDRRRS